MREHFLVLKEQQKIDEGNLYLDTSDDSFIVGTPVVALNQLETGRSEVVHWNKIRFNLNTSNVAQ